MSSPSTCVVHTSDIVLRTAVTTYGRSDSIRGTGLCLRTKQGR
jgi:hypothetical protein